MISPEKALGTVRNTENTIENKLDLFGRAVTIQAIGIRSIKAFLRL